MKLNVNFIFSYIQWKQLMGIMNEGGLRQMLR